MEKGTIISLKNINVARDGRQILSDVSLDVKEGDFLAITGPNGGGKTTLLRVILRLISPSSGTVAYYNPDGSKCKKLSVGYLPQKNMIDSRFPITVEEVVRSGMLHSGQNKVSTENAVEQTLKMIELESHRNATIGTLSGGQLQRTLLGRALISRPSVLVLDEPLSYIDKHFEQHIYRIIENIAPYTTILLVSHEMSVISNMANRHIIVDKTLHDCCAHRHFIPTDCC